MNIDLVYNEIVKLLNDNNLWAEVGIDPISHTIEIEISWGDWKHEHLRTDFLVGTYLNSKGIPFMKSEKETENDGSDTYSSIHYYKLLYVGQIS